MEKKSFKRKHKEKNPVLAICYDFDKTLSPDDMQAQGYIQSVGYDIKDFWDESNQLAEENDMDQNLAWMLTMKNKADGYLAFTKSKLKEYGAKVGFFPGVEEWFSRIRQYGKEHGITVEHYIISSGLKEMIEGTPFAHEFEKIYASSFYYNEDGIAVWPAQVINYTNKTQFLFRIEKDVLDINDPGVNDFFPPENIRVPFRNIVYIGDSDTDIPCMKLVNKSGGHSIGVFNVKTEDKAKVYKMMQENRIKYYVPADYSEGSEIDLLVKDIICKTEMNERLEEAFYRCEKEADLAYTQNDEEERGKIDSLIALENSSSFAATHSIIKRLQEYRSWTPDEKEHLFSIAVHNSQVGCILGDSDVKAFYLKLLSEMENSTENGEAVRKALEKDSESRKRNRL